MERILMTRSGATLVPTDPYAEETLTSIPSTEYFWVEIKRARNPGHHRRFFALLSLIWPSLSDQYANIEELRHHLQVRAGHRHTLWLPDGERAYVPTSIAWNRMTENEFQSMWDRIVDIVVADIMPGIDKATLLDEVEKILRLKDDRARQ